MSGKFAAFALAFVVFSVGLEAQDDYNVSISDYTYNGSNGCSGFGACDSDSSTVTDSSGIQSSGWTFAGNSWQVAFPPGQLQTLDPSWTDQFNAVQTRIQQAAQNATSAMANGVLDAAQWERNVLAGVQANPAGAVAAVADTALAVHGALTGNPGEIDLAGELLGTGATLVDNALNGKTPAEGYSAAAGGEVVDLSGSKGGQLGYAGLGAIQSLNDFANAGADVSNPPLQIIPAPDPVLLPLSTSPLPNGNPPAVSSNTGPFTIGDPGNVTIVDPPSTGNPSTVIDLNTDTEAQQMLLQAKQSQQSLVSEQQQLQSQASQYQNQGQQAIQQSEILVQAATNNAISNAAGNFSQGNVQPGNTASNGNALQNLSGLLSAFSKTGQLSGTSGHPPSTLVPNSPAISSDQQAAQNLIYQLYQNGVYRGTNMEQSVAQSLAAEGYSVTAPQTAAPQIQLGPTGVTCQTVGPKKILECTGTLPSYMTPPK